MFRILSVCILLSFLSVTPALANDSEEGFISKSWHSLTSYFSDESDDEEHHQSKGKHDKKKHDSDDSGDDDERSEEGDGVTPTPTPVADTVPPTINYPLLVE